jgi:hypothetical protein
LTYKARGKKTSLCLKCGVVEEEHKERCYKSIIWFLDYPKFYLFHSEGESSRYADLLRLARLRIIYNLKIQVTFQLSDSRYIADFTYWDTRIVSFYHPNGRFVIEDYKGRYEGDIFKKKWQEMQRLYPKNYYKISDKPSGIKLKKG